MELDFNIIKENYKLTLNDEGKVIIQLDDEEGNFTTYPLEENSSKERMEITPEDYTLLILGIKKIDVINRLIVDKE